MIERTGAARSKEQEPRFIGAGFQKCGTSSLFSTLIRHVPFFSRPAYPKSGGKELHAIPQNRSAQEGDREAYLRALGPITPGINEPLDFTPNYAHRPTTMSNIRQMFPSVKIFLIVRNPTDRFYSALDHAKQSGQVDPNLSDFEAFKMSSSPTAPRLFGWSRNFLVHGIYVPAVNAAYRLFGQNNVFLTSLELIQSQASQKELARLAEFVGVDRTTFDGVAFHHTNQSQNSHRLFRNIPRTRRTKKGESSITGFYNRWDDALAKLLEERES